MCDERHRHWYLLYVERWTGHKMLREDKGKLAEQVHRNGFLTHQIFLQ